LPPSHDPGPADAGAILTIDLGALVANWRRLAARAAPAECSAVVKADAYGIGIEPAVRALAKAGCRTFFVAHPAEGRRARAVAPDAAIYVLNGLLGGSEDVYRRHDLRPVLGSAEEIALWSRSRAAGPAAVQVDTGMNRLGLSPEAAAVLLAPESPRPGFAVALLMGHFVASEDVSTPLNGRQIAAFQQLRGRLPDLPASLANSSGIFLPQRPHYDLVRPGYALYGGNPTPGERNPMSNVVRLEARIIQCRTVERGETVGYNAQWTAGSRRRLATIGVGYADGFPRAAGGTDRHAGAAAMVAGMRCPFVGRVSMDLIVIDVTDAAPAPQPGDSIELIGESLTVDEVGRSAGTIGYEILTGLGRRYHRVYVGG
jgi:alanine racemase